MWTDTKPALWLSQAARPVRLEQCLCNTRYPFQSYFLTFNYKFVDQTDGPIVQVGIAGSKTESNGFNHSSFFQFDELFFGVIVFHGTHDSDDDAHGCFLKSNASSEIGACISSKNYNISVD